MNLIFKEIEYQKIEVSKTPQKCDAKKNNIVVKDGECLNNGYLFSKKFADVNMVEGFLLTYFEDGTIESVGHVWNEINGVYFDETIGLKKNEKKITKNEYYLAEKYPLTDISIELRRKVLIGLSSYLEEPIMEKHLIFKTDVKKLEKELKELLNKKEETKE